MVDEKKFPVCRKLFLKTFRDITTFSCNEQFQAWTDNEGTLFNISIVIVKF